MKLQELLERQHSQQSQVVFQTNDINEYQAFIDKQSAGSDQYHFGEISPMGSDAIFDIIVEVTDSSYFPQTRVDPEENSIEWDVTLYGTGDFDNETSFYFRKGSFPLTSEDAQQIEESLIEQRADAGTDEPPYDY